MEKFTYIGKDIPRLDGMDKATGKLKFMTDLDIPGALFGKLYRSKYPHAWVKSINKESALAIDGVVHVITFQDVPGLNAVGIDTFEQPVLTNKARYIGDAIALILAESLEQAEEGVKRLEVEYEILEPIFDPEIALTTDYVRIHEDGNVLKTFEAEFGNPDMAFLEADLVVENTYEVPWQDNCPIETEGGFGVPGDDGTITIFCPNQQGHYARYQIARVLDIPEDKVIMRTSPLGGAFGRKLDVDFPALLGLGAYISKKPVKIHLSREESFMRTKRHPAKIRLKTGVKKDGTFLAQEVYMLYNAGAYSSYSITVMGLSLEHSYGVYIIPNIKMKGDCVYTNNVIGGAFRGFGNNQINFAVESQVDIIANRLGMDPLELRTLNCIKEGQRHSMGQAVASSKGVLAILEKVKGSDLWNNRFDFKKNEKEPWIKRGVNFAICQQGAGMGLNYPGGDQSSAVVEALSDGTYNVFIRNEEMGQGNLTIFAMIAAEELGVDIGLINVVVGDTSSCLESGPTTASRTTLISGRVVQHAARMMKRRLEYHGAQMLRVPMSEVIVDNNRLYVQNGDALELSEVNQALIELRLNRALFKDDVPETDIEPVHGIGIHYIYSYCAHIAAVEVNTLTGKTNVLAVEVIPEAGRVINRLTYEGQTEGGTVQGLGYGIMENFLTDHGRIITENFQTYLIPTIADIPEIKVTPVELLDRTGPFGAKGLAEPVMVSIAPAITNAICDAIGVRVRTLPANSERILDSLQRLEFEDIAE